MKPENKAETTTLRRRTLLVIGTIQVLFLITVMAVLNQFSRTTGSENIAGTVANLEEAVAKEKLIADSVTELSRLVRKKGYELAVDDIIKDHRESMAAIKKELPGLKKMDNRSSDGRLVYIISVLMVLNSLVLIIYFSLFLKGLSEPIGLISGHMDDIMAGKRPHLSGVDKVRGLRDFYQKFAGLVEFMESMEEKKASEARAVKKKASRKNK